MHYAELKAAWAELTGPGAPFEIAVVNVRGSPMRTYAHAPPTVREVWRASAAFAEREYLIYQDERITYGEAHARVGALAAWLSARGLRVGDRVAIALRNYPEWLLAYWACVASGLVAVGMNAWWTPEEMAYAIADSEPKVIVCDAERLERLLSRPQMTRGAALVGVRLAAPVAGVVPWAEAVAGPGGLPAAVIDPDDDACIFYTSGTTGFPKGAQLTHRGCVANLMSMAFGGQVTALATARATGLAIEAAAPAPIPVSLITTPLFHVTANNCAAYGVTAGGGKLVLMYRWDAGEALRLIETEKVSTMSGVPVMSRELITHPDFARRDLTSLVALGGGGAQLPPDLVLRIDEAVATARPITGYGMTETCGIITSLSADFFVDKPSSAGPVMPCYEAKCVDDAGEEVAAGRTGELWVRGAQVIKGYINRPEATAETITDGWLHTGDIARLDEAGFIYIVDRKKEMILRGGENIYCAEVEAAVYRHEAVAECSAFGVADERLGEEVGLALHIRSEFGLTADELRAHLAALMARHKIPRYVWIMPEPLPRNASGKFLRRQLRDRLCLADAL